VLFRSENDGTIEDLTLKVDCKDGFSGETQCSELLLGISNYGFRRNYASDADIPFSIGKM